MCSSDLAVEADVGVSLRDDRIAERLSEGAVDAFLEVGQRGKSIASTNRLRIGDGEIVEEKVRADAECMRSGLVGQVVDHFEEAIVTRSR